MTPSILARVNYRARTSDLLSTDWDADDVPTAPKPIARTRKRVEISDRFLLGLDPEAAEATLRPLVQSGHRDLEPAEQERILASFLRKRARLAARAARPSATPRVHAVKIAHRTHTNEIA